MCWTSAKTISADFCIEAVKESASRCDDPHRTSNQGCDWRRLEGPYCTFRKFLSSSSHVRVGTRTCSSRRGILASTREGAGEARRAVNVQGLSNNWDWGRQPHETPQGARSCGRHHEELAPPNRPPRRWSLSRAIL